MSRADEVVRLLHIAETWRDPNEGRSHITGRQHALRCAALGFRYGHDLGFLGLVHDLARPMSDVFHGEVIAEIVRDRIDEDGYQILRTHGEFQTALNHGLEMPHRDEPWYRHAARFMAIEERSFAVECATLGIADAEHLIRSRLAD